MNFCRKHSSYQDAAKIQAEVATWTSELFSSIPELDGPVLELGAGTGLLTQHLAKEFPVLVASDLSESMVKFGQTNVPSPTWKVLDAWNLPENTSYAGIVSSSLLQWCTAPQKVFSHCFSILNSGGWMLHTFFTEGTLYEMEQISPTALAIEFRSAEEWVNDFHASGFEVLQTDTREDILYFPSALSLFRNLHNLGATTPNKIKPTKLRMILKDYEDRFSSKQGISAQWNSTRVLCRRSV